MYKPTIRVGDSFRTKSETDHYGTATLTIEKIVHDPEWKPSYGTEQSNSWVYYKIDPKTHSKTHDRARFWWFSDHCERILTKDERSVILYAETCLVDSYGKMAQIRMNKEDLAALDRFKEEGLLDYGRLSAKEIMNVHNIIHGTHWVRFTEEAWTLAHKLRRERAARMVQ
jgi:hypothetical protein